jgi:hypothetical protein
LKIKAVQTSPRLVPELSKLAPVQRDAATLNILSRLASSKPAKEALNTAIEDVQAAAGVVRKASKKEGSPPVKEKKAAPAVLNPLEITDEEDAVDGDSEEGDSDDEFGGFDDRLGSDGSDDDNGSDDSMDDAPPPSKPKASAFMSSLSAGYMVGSGSEAESDIEELAPKKNRRGQRARQQIAEKKFGAKAKHLENPKNDRSQGWDAKRGATDGARGGRGGRGGFGAGRGGFGTGANRGGGFGKGAPAHGRSAVGDAPAPPKKKHNDDEGPLHPSWAAAKAAKDKKAVPIVFTGKKISFD